MRSSARTYSNRWKQQCSLRRRRKKGHRPLGQSRAHESHELRQSEYQLFESVGRFVYDSLVFGELMKQKQRICPSDILLDKITNRSKAFNAIVEYSWQPLCCTCVVVLIVSQLPIGIQHFLLRSSSVQRGVETRAPIWHSRIFSRCRKKKAW